MKKEKDIAPLDFPKYLKNQSLQRTANFIEMKAIVISAKLDRMYNILKSLLCSHWLLVEA